DWSVTDKLEAQANQETGAKVMSHRRYVAFQMAEVAISRQIFQPVLRLIVELRPPGWASRDVLSFFANWMPGGSPCPVSLSNSVPEGLLTPNVGIDGDEDFHPMYVPRFVKSALGPMYREFKNDAAFRRSFEGFPPPLDRIMRRVSRTRFSCSDEHNIPGWLTANERRALYA